MVWPVYFDSSKSREQGRKIPKKLAVPNPKLEEIVRAAQKLNLKIEVVEDAAYPKMPWRRTGLIFIEKRGKSKLEILKLIGQKLAEMRAGLRK